jgi:hypothetical protein
MSCWRGLEGGGRQAESWSCGRSTWDNWAGESKDWRSTVILFVARSIHFFVSGNRNLHVILLFRITWNEVQIGKIVDVTHLLIF